MTATLLSVPRLSLELAGILLDAAEAKALDMGQPLCLAVVDESGFLIAFRRMDGAKSVSCEIAQEKARTAALVRKPTHVLNKASEPGKPLFSFHTSGGGGLTLLMGGVPVTVDGAVVGGFGASSGTPEEDLMAAEEGLRRFYEKTGFKA
ncbi:MAG: GlcG/HbpS family heme-binding protein [Magnetovibrionaceae bacterium]